MAEKKNRKLANLDTTSWDLSPMFNSDEDPQIAKELNLVRGKTEAFVDKWADRKDYLDDPQVLKSALDDYENWAKYTGTTGKQGFYFGLRSSQEQTNPQIKAKLNILNDFAVELGNEIQFFELNLAKIPSQKQEEFLNNPILKDYKHYLEQLFAWSEFQLSEKEERIMNYRQKTSLENWISMVSELISQEERKVLNEDGKKETKNFSELVNLISSNQKKVRKSAAEALEEIFAKHLEVAEREINNVCEYGKVSRFIRGFSRPDQPRHLSDDIDTQVVDQLVTSVSDNFSIPTDYYKFKAKLLGQDKLKYYERGVEYGEITSKYSYKEAANMVFEVLSDLDADFGKIFEKFVSQGQLDVFPQKGKVGGAFCAGTKSILPTYILLNHTGQLNDVLTMAHEVGHGINFELIKNRENELNLDVSTAVAEVASTFMEDFVLQKLLSEADEEERLTLMVQKLDSDMATIFRQIAFYNFEFELHNLTKEKGYLTKEEIGQLFKKHMQSYMGEASEGAENWWIYVGHFRRFFYVYSYASGLLISKHLQKMVREDSSQISKVKQMLSIGSSKSPKDLFADLGIDIADSAFWESGIEEIKNEFNAVKKLAKKLEKI